MHKRMIVLFFLNKEVQMSVSATSYHPSLDFSFLPSGYISYVNKHPLGRYDVTKTSYEDVRFVVVLCSNLFRQLVMMHDLILIGCDRHATLKEKELVPLAAEIFMIVPERTKGDFYQALCTEPKILKIFADAVAENVVRHRLLERESKRRLSSSELKVQKEKALVMLSRDVVCLSEEQLLRERGFDVLFRERKNSDEFFLKMNISPRNRGI
jgi:hypothetical protein